MVIVGVFVLEEKKTVNHSLIIENRKKFTISGIKDVISFDEETIVTDSVMGKLVIKGDGLHILNFNTETYDLSGEGKVHAIVYTANEQGGSFFSKIFR